MSTEELLDNRVGDYQGNPLTADEQDSDIVFAWKISPGTVADEVIIRDYLRAVDYACDRICDRMDEATEDDLIEHGVSVKVGLVRITVGELRRLESEDEL